MFILSTILNTYNDYTTRKGRSSCKDRTCKSKTSRTREFFRDSKARSSELFNGRRIAKGNVSIRSKIQQCTFNTEAQSRIRLYISLIPLFIFYNPYIIIILIYIDTLFSDELISMTVIQLNVTINLLQTFINRGVV